jgi:hypothetical protein
MDKQRIEELARLLPADATMFTAGRKPGDPAPRLAEQLAIATNDPAFCHRFIIEFVLRKEPLPPAVWEACLRRAHYHFGCDGGHPDPVLLEVEQLALPSGRFKRQVLQALLVSSDCSYTQIAGWLDLGEPAVRLYELLYFNVRNRYAETAYVAGLIFPEGRLQLLKTDAVDSIPFEARLLMAGYLYGAPEVLWLAGMNTDQTPPSITQSLKEFEETLLQNAVKLARSGALNASSAPGIAHGKSLLVSKRNVEPLKDSARENHLPDISLGNAILLSMRRKTDKEAEEEIAAADALLEEHEKYFRERAGR